MSRELKWNLSEDEVKEAITLWVESQPFGDKVEKVIIDNPNKASTIRFIAECILPGKHYGGINRVKRSPMLND